MKVQPVYNYVDRKLIRGAQVTSPVELFRMKRTGVNQIIDLCNERGFKLFFEKKFCKFLGLKYINYPSSFRDGSAFEKGYYQKINKIISENDGITYLHCKKGKHRTGLCVAAYEKEVLKKSNPEIIYNLYTTSFDELVNGKKESLVVALKNCEKLFDLR
jgi:protein tyrosine/serine phosphatase